MIYNSNLNYELCTYDNIYYLKSKLLSSFNVKHLFALKFGGVSSGVFDSLNVSSARKDKDGNTDSCANIYENYKRVLDVYNVEPQKAVAAKQVHGNKVVIAQNGGVNIESECTSDGEDGIIVCKDNSFVDAVSIKTADCVPILFYDKKSGNVAGVHAGHRGTCLEIAKVCALQMMKISGASVKDIYVAIGPCIGVCCYEVSADVAANVSKAVNDKTTFEKLCIKKDNGKFMLDLAGVNSVILQNIGVPVENIDICPYKTCCFELNDIPAFFSHRKSGGFSGTFPSVICKN